VTPPVFLAIALGRPKAPYLKPDSAKVYGHRGPATAARNRWSKLGLEAYSYQFTGLDENKLPTWKRYE
jgi:hypothetical protein